MFIIFLICKFQIVNKFTVGAAIASSWIVPAVAATLAATKSFKHNEMCIPSHSETKVATVSGYYN